MEDIVEYKTHPLEPAPQPTPARLLQMAIAKDLDIEKLERLIVLQERWEANEARKAFIRAMAEFKRSPPTIVKNKKAGFGHKSGGGRTEYDYASLDQVAIEIGKAMAVHGLSAAWHIKQTEEITVTCVITHEMGHSGEPVTMSASPDTSGTKNPIQAIASAVSYLEKYTLLAAAGLAASGMDNDGNSTVPSAPTITDDQAATLEALLEEVAGNRGLFCKYFGIPDISELPADQLSNAVAMLERKRKQ